MFARRVLLGYGLHQLFVEQIDVRRELILIIFYRLLQLLLNNNLPLLHQIQKLLLGYWLPYLSDEIRN